MTTPTTIIIPEKSHPLTFDHLSLQDLAFIPSVLPEVIIGVDTHKDIHVAAALTTLGQVLGTYSFPTTKRGCESLLSWASAVGIITGFGIEGTGSYGKTLTTFLHHHGYTIIEVNRGNRQTRRQLGKTDTIDAITAARSVLSGQATTTPKTSDGSVEMIHQLKIVRDNIVKNMTETINIFHDMLLSAPEDMKQKLQGKTTLEQVKTCALSTSEAMNTVTDSVQYTLNVLAQRWLTSREEAKDLEKKIHTLIHDTHPELLDEFGIGPEVAATILTAIGDNLERITSEAALAQLAGIAPIPASSGKITRHRLNQGGNRKLNSAIHTIVMIRMRSHEETKIYITKRLSEGKTLREIRRSLKRYIIRHIYKILQQPPQTPQTTH